MDHGVTAGKIGAQSRTRQARGRPDSRSSCRCSTKSAGLAALHQRLVAAAKALKKSRGLAIEIVYVDDGSSDDTLENRPQAARQGRRPADRFAFAQFRQGSGAARRARIRAPRRAPVHGRRRPASARADRAAGQAVARRRQRRGLYNEGASRERVGVAPPCGQAVLSPAQLRRPATDPGGRRRLPAAVAARGRGAEAHAGAQPLLQGAFELDRLPPGGRALRAAGAQARPLELEFSRARRALDRRPHRVLHHAAAHREPARAFCSPRARSSSASGFSARRSSSAATCPAILR